MFRWMCFVELSRKADHRVTCHGNLTGRRHKTDRVLEAETDLDQEVNLVVDMAGQGQGVVLDMVTDIPDHEVDQGRGPVVGGILAQDQEEEGQGRHPQGHLLGHGQDGEV